MIGDTRYQISDFEGVCYSQCQRCLMFSSLCFLLVDESHEIFFETGFTSFNSCNWVCILKADNIFQARIFFLQFCVAFSKLDDFIMLQ